MDFRNATLWYDPAQYDPGFNDTDAIVASYILDPGSSCPGSVHLVKTGFAYIHVIRDPCPTCTVETNVVGLPSLVWNSHTRQLGIAGAGTLLTDEPLRKTPLAAHEEMAVQYDAMDAAGTTSQLRVVSLEGWTLKPLASGGAVPMWDQAFPWDG